MSMCDGAPEIRHFELLEEMADDGIPEWVDEDRHLTDYEHDYVVYAAEEQATEERKILSQIGDYMENQCKACSFGKGSHECENCYVGGY